MKLGFSKVLRKFSKLGKDRMLAISEDIFYFLDDSGHVIARLHAENLLTLIVTDNEGNYYYLNLAYNFKHKCGQEVIKGDIAFLSELVDDKMPIIVKNRGVKYVREESLTEYTLKSCGTVKFTNDVLEVNVPMIALNTKVNGAVQNNAEPHTFWSLVVRTIH